ncbi:MAG: helix-turn-helix domain containing protein [Parvibaculaceae bacterium]|nr:helix-turn-helix domain containing protein [Parvibaculaceae bacterium]
MKAEDTRDALKLAARRLFAARGIDGVSVREIVAAAGQRNSGSLHYYFGSKEGLIRELVVDGAKLIDERRNAWLDAREANGLSLRDTVEALVWPSTRLGGTAEEDTYIRFIMMLQMHHRDQFLDALENKWNSGYLRCLALIRHLLPEVPAAIMTRRLLFMGLLLSSALSSREAAFDDQPWARPFWAQKGTMEALIVSIENLLGGPV